MVTIQNGLAYLKRGESLIQKGFVGLDAGELMKMPNQS
jgi:hypothetical protein